MVSYGHSGANGIAYTMAYTQKKPAVLSRLLASRIFQVVLVVLIIAMGWQVTERYTVERHAAERRAATEAEYERLKEQREELANHVSTIQNDFGVEAEIRQNFDVARPGEEIVIILDDDMHAIPERSGPPEPSGEEAAQEPTRWYEFWR